MHGCSDQTLTSLLALSNSLLRCFNAAKNYQIAVAEHSWYTGEPEHITSWDSGDKGGTSWSGRLIGVAEYDTNPNKLPIVLKLETGTDRNYFVGFK